MNNDDKIVIIRLLLLLLLMLDMISKTNRQITSKTTILVYC